MSVRIRVVGILVLALTGCGSSAGGGPRTVTQVVTVPAQTSSTSTASTTTTSAPPVPTSREPLSWDALFTKVEPTVMRLSTTSCDSSGFLASGFLVGPDLVMTASHVVHDARTISVQSESGTLLAGKVVGDDPRHDVGLVRLDKSVSIRPLVLQPALPGRGSKIAVVGYPLGVENLRITEGIVSGVPVPVDYGVQYVEHAFTTDAATNGGNSGGPAFNDSGEVVGLVSGGQDWQPGSVQRPAQGTNYLIPSEDLAAALSAWRSRTADLATPCSDENQGGLNADVDFPVSVETDDAHADFAAHVLHAYGLAISAGAYEAAWGSLSKRMQGGAGGLQAFKRGLVSSLWTELRITSAAERPNGDLRVGAVLTTTQDSQFGPKGHTCSIWHLTYSMVKAGGTYLIDGAKGTEASC